MGQFVFKANRLEDKSKSDDKKELTPFNAFLDASKYLETIDVNDSVAYDIASAWCLEVTNGYPGKVTDMKLFVAMKKIEWDEYYKLLKDRACEKARRLSLSLEEREELEKKEEEERRARRPDEL